MTEWMPALGGGLLIGVAALLLYATLGRIAGVSNIAYGGIWAAGDRRWRWVFLAGLIGGGWLAALVFGALPAPASPAGASIVVAVIAGLLVGFGTRLGNGCTSGHGVCGLARLSPRSLASVLVFMAVGMATATLLRPLLQ